MTTPQQLLDLPLPDNGSEATTVRGYLVALLETLWREEGNFSGRRPFGESGWQYDLYRPMIRVGMVKAELAEDGGIVRLDRRAADEQILAAIRHLGVTP